METPENVDSYIHTLIQQREFDFNGFIQEHGGRIDDHVLVCKECHSKMISWTSHLPKLRKQMTVDLSNISANNRFDQLRQLGKGQCLPCGCVVTRVASTREEVKFDFYKSLAKIMDVPIEKVENIPETTRLMELPLCIRNLRRLRDSFWLPDGSYGSVELRDAEEGDVVRQLPETVCDFIERAFLMRSSMSYTECPDCWVP